MSLKHKVISLVIIWLGINLCLAQIDDHDHDHDEEHISTTIDEHDHDHNHQHSDIWLAVLITSFAGLAAFIGAFSIFCVKKEQIGIIPISLSFASGVIIYLSFMNLIPAAIEQILSSSGEDNEALAHFYSTLCVIFGFLITAAMEYLFHRLGVDPHSAYDQNHRNNKNNHGYTPTNSKHLVQITSTTNVNTNGNVNINDEEDEEEDDDSDDSQDMHSGKININPVSRPDNLKHVSRAVAFALVLHHFPEGIATFVSLYYDLEFGILVAFALFVHDIPGGICIAVPSYLATGSKKQPFFLCFVAACVYPVGAFIGWIIVETASETFVEGFIGVLFGITAGIMLHVAFVELLPTAVITANRLSASNLKNNGSKCYGNVVVVSVILLFTGFLIMDISTILLESSGGHDH